MRFRIVPGLMAAVLLVSCGGQQATNAVTVARKDTSRVCSLAFGVSPANATLHVGDTLRFTVSYDAVCMPGAVWRWLSNDTSLVLVDSTSGVAHAHAKGTATLIATNINDPNVKGAATVNVIQ